MRIVDKVIQGARHVKDSLRPSSPSANTERASTSATNSPAPGPVPAESSSVLTGASARMSAISKSLPAIIPLAPVSASSLSAGASYTKPADTQQKTTNMHVLAVASLVSTCGDETPGRTAWAGLKTFTKLLHQSADAFGPLKSAVEGILGCIEIYERFGEGREDYKFLKNELDSLFKELCDTFGEAVPPTMTRTLENLARGIKTEVALIQTKGRHNTAERIMEVNRDADEILDYYRRIERLLQQIAVNTNVSAWKLRDEFITEARLEGLAPSKSARYNSSDSIGLNRGGCTPNTRVQILEVLRFWASGSDSEKIYWLNGMAGTGKTTIAYSLCERLEEASKLAASFFCSRQLPECRDPNLFFPTIAYQLARFSLPFRFALSQVIERDPDVRTQLLPDQLRLLILEPLREIKDCLPEDLVIVIDALDECEKADSVSQILHTLLTHAPDLPVKFFLTSRPEQHIREQMTNRQGERTRFELHLHNLDSSIVKEDIKTYLSYALGRMCLPSADLERLVDQSGVLFIYAATVVRYLSNENFAMCSERLQLVLEASGASSNDNKEENGLPNNKRGQPSSSNRSLEKIDELYTLILRAAIKKSGLEVHEEERRRLVLYTVVCAKEPLTASSIAALLKLGSDSLVHGALHPLLSVINIHGEDKLVTTLHESFPNYMLDPNRAREFHCNVRKHNARIADACFRLIKTPDPPFNICRLESSHLFDQDITDLYARVEESISKELRYACRYWGAHLVLAEPSESLSDALSEFLHTRFLLWMEVLNLTQCISLGAGILPGIQTWCQSAGSSDEVRQLAQDGWGFVTSYSSSPMSRSTPHIYVSALPFWPKERPISKCYMSQLQGLIEPTGTAMGSRNTASLAVCRSKNTTYAVAYSSDGTRIVSGSEDNTIQIWDAHTGQPIGDPLQGHTGIVRSVAYSPDGACVSSGSKDKTVRIWDAQTGEAIGSPLRGHTGIVRSVAYSPDGTRIVSSSRDRTLRIWEVKTGRTIGKPLEGHTSRVMSAAYSPDGTRIVSGSSDTTIRTWDAYTGRPVGEPFQGHSNTVYSVAYSPDGSRIVSGSYDATVRIWDADTGEAVYEPLRGHTDTVYSVAYSPDGTRIVSSSYDETVRIWDAKTGQAIGKALEGHTGTVYSVAYSPDGARVVSSSKDKTLRIWDAQASQVIGEPLQGHTSMVMSVAYSPKATYFVSGSSDATVQVWDAQTGQAIGKPFKDNDDPIFSIAFSPAGDRIVSGSDGKTVRIWDVYTRQTIGEPLQCHTGTVMAVAYSPDGACIVSGSSDKTILIWDAHTGQTIGKPLEGHTDTVSSVAYSPDGARIVSGSYDTTIRVWDAHTGRAIGEPFKGHNNAVMSVACSHDGTRIFSGSQDKTVRIWNTHTGQAIGKPLEGHTSTVMSVACSPDGTRIASGSYDTTIRIWDAYTGQAIDEPLEGHASRVMSVAYSPDSTRIVSGSHDATVRVWYTDIKSQNVSDGHTSLQSHWKINKDGWALDDHSGLLIWVPPDLRGVLLRPQNTTIISRQGSLSLDLGPAQTGKSWGDCYRAVRSS